MEPEGFEPSTLCLQGKCSPISSYDPITTQAGIEPALLTDKPVYLYIKSTSIILLGQSEQWDSNSHVLPSKGSCLPFSCTLRKYPQRESNSYRRFRRPMLCPLSYADVMLDVGFEPTTPGISDQCSTTELIQQSGPDWNRTSDTRIFSPLLYQLSYLGV